MIRFDRTQRSVVTVCKACGARDVLNDQREADAWATSHIERAHPVADRSQLVDSITASQAATRKRRERNNRDTR